MDECLSVGKQGRWSNWFEKTPPDANVYNGITYQESKSETKYAFLLIFLYASLSFLLSLSVFHFCKSFNIPFSHFLSDGYEGTLLSSPLGEYFYIIRIFAIR